jgi:hypothetical protein
MLALRPKMVLRGYQHILSRGYVLMLVRLCLILSSGLVRLDMAAGEGFRRDMFLESGQ